MSQEFWHSFITSLNDAILHGQKENMQRDYERFMREVNQAMHNIQTAPYSLMEKQMLFSQLRRQVESYLARYANDEARLRCIDALNEAAKHLK